MILKNNKYISSLVVCDIMKSTFEVMKCLKYILIRKTNRCGGTVLANLIKDDLIICLEGDLGAGKTLFTQNFCKALNVKE